MKLLQLRSAWAAVKTSAATISSSSRWNSLSDSRTWLRALNFFAEVLFQCGAIAYVRTALVFQVLQFLNQQCFGLLFFGCHG
jgi:hypothetical protein